MLRVASCAPSLLRVGFAGDVGACIDRHDVAARASRSPRNFASMMWLVAFAANTAHTITTAPPRTQK